MSKTETFYSVSYRAWGADRPYTKWFDDKEKAEAFAARPYSDKVVRHTYKDAEKIREARSKIDSPPWKDWR